MAAFGPILRLAPETIEILAGVALRLIAGAGETPGAASAIAYEAVMALYDDVFRGSAASPAAEGTMRPVIDHIVAHLGSRLTVTDLAAVAGHSRAHFSRIFAEQEGTPPAEFVLQERMRRAAKLLATNAAMSVKEISAVVGFVDPNYFAKVFRRVFGTSPTEFRTTGMYTSIAPPPEDRAGNCGAGSPDGVSRSPMTPVGWSTDRAEHDG
jgi:AraC-like DNA-binding protein